METFETSDIVSVGDCSSERRDVLSILWNITMWCNYRCSYCHYAKLAKSKGFSSKENLLRGAQAIVRLGRPGYQITLYGGEPTYHPYFQDLLEYFVGSEAPISLRIFTNGSRPPSFFQNMVPASRATRFGVIFSLHPEYVDFRQFKQSVEITAGSGMSVGIGLMFVPSSRELMRGYIDELLELRRKAPFFMSLNFPYTAEGIMGDGCSADDFAWVRATREAFDLIPMPNHLISPFFTRIMNSITLERNGERQTLAPEESLQLLSKLNTPSYQGFYCCGGANVIFIEADGAVRGGVCDASQVLGNIFYDSEIAIIQNMRVVGCNSNSCGSIENIPLPKFKALTEAEACLADFKKRAKNYLYRAEAARLAPAPPPGDTRSGAIGPLSAKWAVCGR